MTRLFLRASRRMVLTEAGRRLLGAAISVLPALAEVEQDILRIAGGKAGVLRVSTACYTCYHWLNARFWTTGWW